MLHYCLTNHFRPSLAQSMNFYINTFKKFGFTGPTNWYRARMMNFEDEKTLENPMQVIEQPSLMLTAQYDRILVPQMTDHMPAFFKNLTIEVSSLFLLLYAKRR